ncbi:hypothetical protein EI982_12345 [Haloplanus rallus]|jgi:hypothetical protein|uniref:Uncharacterized protein n=1 Tax=Haloplanus rallus TaxID=1816183 RepID=A0A6B9FGR7_9EURY|nr:MULTISPECIES: hypothetical protein [Haloplanus]QGX95523.1 hypothetical protein EI982_12345 [Haloplanus rallus]
MAAVSDTHDDRFGPASGKRTPDAQVALGAVMLATVLAVAAAGYVLGSGAAARTAVVMLPLLVAASLRTSLADHSAYVSLSRRR